MIPGNVEVAIRRMRLLADTALGSLYEVECQREMRNACILLENAYKAPEKEDWRDDPSADERWNAGLDYAMVRFCQCLGVDPKDVRWDAATEELDGDVCAVIGNILRAKFGEDFDPDLVARSSAETGDSKLPLHYEDGPDYCTVTDAQGSAFALTVQPDLMQAMERALRADIDRLSRPPVINASPQTAWQCAARKQGTPGGNAPADCDWPNCGCDPAANKVLKAIDEAGFEITKRGPDKPLQCLRCGTIDAFGSISKESQLATLIQTIEAEARRYAEMYPQSSDGRNTFIIFADWIASLALSRPNQGG